MHKQMAIKSKNERTIDPFSQRNRSRKMANLISELALALYHELGVEHLLPS